MLVWGKAKAKAWTLARQYLSLLDYWITKDDSEDQLERTTMGNNTRRRLSHINRTLSNLITTIAGVFACANSSARSWASKVSRFRSRVHEIIGVLD